MKIRCGTFNLFQFAQPPYSFYIRKDRFSKEKWEEKTTWIKKQIQTMNCDVIGFQEVFTPKALEEICFELGFKYFKTIEEAKVRFEHDTIFQSTTVAIASKYPISKLTSVKEDTNSLKKHNLNTKFKFQRKPIKATININNQEIVFYICHLKSNRLNEFEYLFKKNDTLEHKKVMVQKALKEDFSPALKQRLCEASSLYIDIKNEKLPKILMADLNDKEFSLTIDALTNKAYHETRKNSKYLLYDPFYLYDYKNPNPHPEAKEEKRVPTSYFQGNGNILDYIFISKEFNKNNKHALAYISSYEVLDEHLKQTSNGSLLQSDHAQVVCELSFN